MWGARLVAQHPSTPHCRASLATVANKDVRASWQQEKPSQLVHAMREVHDVCDEHGDVATASLLENWIDEGERRVWFLYEATRTGTGGES